MPGSFSLILETSTAQASLALVAPDGSIKHRSFRSDRNHNAMLFEPLDELLHDMQPHGIGLVLVGSGPGSYSGTRVGIAAAQGVAIAMGCPAVALPSLLAVPTARHGLPCLAIGDARRGSYWCARVENFCLTQPPALCDAHGLAATVTAATQNALPVFSFEQPSGFPLPSPLAEHITLETPDAIGLWLAWQHSDASTRRIWQADIPQPLYLKPPHITVSKNPIGPSWARPDSP